MMLQYINNKTSCILEHTTTSSCMGSSEIRSSLGDISSLWHWEWVIRRRTTLTFLAVDVAD